MVEMTGELALKNGIERLTGPYVFGISIFSLIFNSL
jgi:hypothetical protein